MLTCCPGQGIRVSGQPWRGALKIAELICCQKELHAMRSGSKADGETDAGAPRVLSLNLQTGVLSVWDRSRLSRVRPDMTLPGWA